MGQQLLSYDFAWAGNRKQGFSEEFERANINLSLVEAQMVSSIQFFGLVCKALLTICCRIFLKAGNTSPLSIAKTL
jgi:hypothetical protein